MINLIVVLLLMVDREEARRRFMKDDNKDTTASPLRRPSTARLDVDVDVDDDHVDIDSDVSRVGGVEMRLAEEENRVTALTSEVTSAPIYVYRTCVCAVFERT